MPNEHVLVVDDDANLAKLLARHLNRAGYRVTCASDGAEALEILLGDDVDLVVSDVQMPVLDGPQLIEELHASSVATPVVLMTAFGTIGQAVEAMRNGAFDYISKPFSLDELLARVRRALKHGSRSAATMDGWEYERMVGRSTAMQRVFGTIERAAKSRSTALITGGSGTGKEMVAQAIHQRSDRRDKPFVVVDGSAIPEPLVESELFGYVRGAFTGAASERAGLFEQAQTGTLFLDEIGCLNLAAQAKLLRAIEQYSVRRLGSNKQIEVDVRYIVATNVDLKQEIVAGRFREDLYYRINVINIVLPALAERREDIPLLVDLFLERARRLRPDSPVTRVGDDALHCLVAYSWPGNVRELANAIERAVVLCDEETVGRALLPREIRSVCRDDTGAAALVSRPPHLRPLSEFVDAHIDRALATTDGNRSVAARLLGIDRRTLQRHLQRRSEDDT